MEIGQVKKNGPKNLFNMLTMWIFIITFCFQGFLVLGHIYAQNSTSKLVKDFLPQKYKFVSKIIQERNRKNSRYFFYFSIIAGMGLISAILHLIYLFVLKDLYKLMALNRKSTRKDIKLYPKDEIPQNEIGEVIESRNKILEELRYYREDMEKRLKEAKHYMVHNSRQNLFKEMLNTAYLDIGALINKGESSCKEMKFIMRSGGDLVKMNDSIRELQESIQQIDTLRSRIQSVLKDESIKTEGNSFKTVLEVSLKVLEKKIEEKNVTIQTYISSIILPFYGNSESIEQVMVNIIDNAINSLETKKVKKIIIRADNFSDMYIKFSVQDTGIGINDDEIKLIFDPFYSTKSTKTAGIGLSTCKNIIEDHFGKIEVDSSESGSEFFVYLPINKTNVPWS